MPYQWKTRYGSSKEAKLEKEIKELKAEKETYLDFIGERGLADEYKAWLKANGWKGE